MPVTDASPLVSIVVPVSGEATRIERCLRAVLAQEWPEARLEVVVVDGAPSDGTAERALRVLDTAPGVRSTVVTNPGGGRSANLNRGLAAAVGSVVCRVDARSAIPPHYVATCVSVLADPTIAVVGGMQTAITPGSGAHAVGIGRGLNNRLSMGMARYRRPGPSGPADTVYLGAFRREQVEAIGGWDEGLDVNEDFDLNTRLQAATGLVWFDSRLRVDYFPRQTVKAIATQYWSFGRWKARYLRSRRERPRLRQAVGLLVAPCALGALVIAAALPRPVRRILGVATLVGALAIEELGTSERRGPVSPVARLWSVATCGAVVVSWSAGAWTEILAGRATRG